MLRSRVSRCSITVAPNLARDTGRHNARRIPSRQRMIKTFGCVARFARPPHAAGMDAPTPRHQIAYRPLAIVRDWHQFRKACRDRCAELAVSRITVDTVGGLPAGQTGKLIAPVPPQGFGPLSFASILGALGLAVVLVEDAEAIARIRHRLVPRNPAQVDACEAMLAKKRKRRPHLWKANPDWGRIMSARRNLIINPDKRRRIAQTAARARWRKHRRKATAP